MPLIWTMLFAFTVSTVMSEVHRRRKVYAAGLRRYLRREVAMHSDVDLETIDRALVEAESSLYPASRRITRNIAALAIILGGYAIVRQVMPERAFSPLHGGWLYLLAGLLTMTPGLIVGLIVNRNYRQTLACEFERRLEARP
jgi:hypothetical protein